MSILNLSRRSTWILVSLAFFARGALAWNFTNCDPWGTCADGAWTVTQDVWGAATNWQQCLYSDSHSHWQVSANLKGQQWVGSYPHANYPVNQPLNDVLSSSRPLLAAWNASYRTDHKFDFAYDLWLNDTTYEVMIWLDWNHTDPIGGRAFTNATIDGITYNVWEGAGGSGPHCISFVPQTVRMDKATNFNLCGILSWISNLRWNGGPGGCYWQNPNFTSVQLGWEVCDTYGDSKTYTMNSFDVYYGTTASRPSAPTGEKVIWQANFGSIFPNGGSHGFSFRDGAPVASGILTTNLTGGVGGSASVEYTVDLSAWSNNPPRSYSGFGVGAVEQPLPCLLASADKASYRVYVLAKAGGTGAGIASVPAKLDLNFFTPTQQVFDLTSPLVLSTNWQLYVFDGETNLQIATWLAGARQLFSQNLTNINKMELQITIPGNPDIGVLFGYDADNTVDIADLKIVELVPKPVLHALIQANGRTKAGWDPAAGKVEEADGNSQSQ